MVINGVENGSPDMNLVSFDGKFDDKKDEIPLGICRPHMLQIFNIGNLRVDIKHKNVINGVPGGPHGSEFGMYLTTISPNIFYAQRGSILIKYSSF